MDRGMERALFAGNRLVLSKFHKKTRKKRKTIFLAADETYITMKIRRKEICKSESRKTFREATLQCVRIYISHRVSLRDVGKPILP